MYGYFAKDSSEKFFVIAPIVYSLLTTCQFCYLFFGLKLMIVEAQMPSGNLTLKQILRRVTLTIYFMKVWIVSFVVY